jgi:hypothetical protein
VHKNILLLARKLIAISASRNRSRIQYCGLQFKLYIKTFKNATASKERVISVLLTTMNGTFILVALSACEIYSISDFFAQLVVFSLRLLCIMLSNDCWKYLHSLSNYFVRLDEFCIISDYIYTYIYIYIYIYISIQTLYIIL